MLRMPSLVVALLATGCRPPAPPAEVTTVAPESLVRAYRDMPNLADDAWRDRRISCHLVQGDYTVVGSEVRWFAAMNREPAIIFTCSAVPADGTRPIVVVGICRGIVRDGKNHGANINFSVRVVDCTVTALPP